MHIPITQKIELFRFAQNNRNFPIESWELDLALEALKTRTMGEALGLLVDIGMDPQHAACALWHSRKRLSRKDTDE